MKSFNIIVVVFILTIFHYISGSPVNQIELENSDAEIQPRYAPFSLMVNYETQAFFKDFNRRKRSVDSGDVEPRFIPEIVSGVGGLVINIGDSILNLLGPVGDVVLVVFNAISGILSPLGNILTIVIDLVRFIYDPVGALLKILGDILNLLIGDINVLLKDVVDNVLVDLYPAVGEIVLSPLRLLLNIVIDFIIPPASNTTVP